MNLLNKYLFFIQNRINRKNRKRLTNRDVTLICSNCTGGVLYHWLNMEFKSPFINLYMDNKDFLTALENFDEFLDCDIIEDKESLESYPVGIACHGEKIHFMHYKDFQTAIYKWNERKNRIDRNNIAVMLTNFGSGLTQKEINECTNERKSEGRERSIVDRFEQLPFKNKIILSGYDLKSKISYRLKNYPDSAPGYNIFRTMNIFGKRYIDQFDNISFINDAKQK